MSLALKLSKDCSSTTSLANTDKRLLSCEGLRCRLAAETLAAATIAGDGEEDEAEDDMVVADKDGGNGDCGIDEAPRLEAAAPGAVVIEEIAQRESLLQPDLNGFTFNVQF